VEYHVTQEAVVTSSRVSRRVSESRRSMSVSKTMSSLSIDDSGCLGGF
jgi:hypothetical protein